MVYTSGKAWLLGHAVLTADVRALLLTSAYTPTSTHDFANDLTGELSGSGYARQTLTGRAILTATGRAALDADDVTFPSLGLAAGQPRYLVLYVEAGTDATRPLLACLDLGVSAGVPNGTDYTVRWDATGILRYVDP